MIPKEPANSQRYLGQAISKFLRIASVRIYSLKQQSPLMTKSEEGRALFIYFLTERIVKAIPLKIQIKEQFQNLFKECKFSSVS